MFMHLNVNKVLIVHKYFYELKTRRPSKKTFAETI